MPDAQPMTGWLCKRYFRVNRWSERYFILSKDRLIYYTSDDRTKEARGKFDLVKGCYVSDISEIEAPTKQLKKKLDKVYCFTILWPQWYDPPKKKKAGENKQSKDTGDGLDFGSDGEFSDNENDSEEEGNGWGGVGGGGGGGGNRSIVNNQQPPSSQITQSPVNINGDVYGGFTGGSLYSSINQNTPQDNLPWVSACGTAAGDSLAKRASSHAAYVKGRNTAAPILEHNKQRHQSAVQAGAMVAGAAAGGAVVGALTMGIGLIPYMAIVGGAAAVGGGTVAYHASNPVDHRLVLTARTLQEARRWKVALEAAIGAKEGRRPRPLGLLNTDRTLKMAIAWNTSRLCSWHCDGVIHGLRLKKCVPKPSLCLASGASSSGASGVGASGSSPALPFGVDEEYWRLIVEGVCEGGSRKMSVPVRAPPLDVFLTLMAALNGSTPKDKNESSFTSNAAGGGTGSIAYNNNNSNNVVGGSGIGGCGICSVGNKDVLSKSIFSSVLGRVVSSVHHLKKIDEHSDILHMRFHQSTQDDAAEGSSFEQGVDGKLARYVSGVATLGSALGAGMLDLIGLQHSNAYGSNRDNGGLSSLLSDGDSCQDGNSFFYASSNLMAGGGSSASPITCSENSESSFWSGALGRLVALVVGKAPRELVVERFWRVDEDGCFIVTLSSTSDESSGWLPPLDSNQHARANCNIVIIIAPRRDYTSFHTRECQECEVEIFVSGSGGGAATSLREASVHRHFSGVNDNEPYHDKHSKKNATLPGNVGDIASGVLRTAAAYLDEKFQLSVMKIIIDLKATVEALEIAPPELALASPILSASSLAEFLENNENNTQDVQNNKRVEESLKRSGVWQLAQTLSPLAPPPAIVGTGCPMNCGACGACAAFAADVLALSQQPPLYPTLRAPGFYFPSSQDEKNNVNKAAKNKSKGGVGIGVKKVSHHHHHHHTSRDGQVFENVWDDDGMSSGSDSSSSSTSSDDASNSSGESSNESDGGRRRKGRGMLVKESDRNKLVSGGSDEDIDELDLLDENGELIVGSDDEYLFENLVSDDDDEAWASALAEIQLVRKKDMAAIKEEITSAVVDTTLDSVSPSSAPSSAQKKKWGYGVFGSRSKRSTTGKSSSSTAASPSSSTDMASPNGSHPTNTPSPTIKPVTSGNNSAQRPSPLVKTSSYRAWSSRSKAATGSSPAPTAAAVAVAVANYEEKTGLSNMDTNSSGLAGSRVRSASGGGGGSSSLPSVSRDLSKSRSLSIERQQAGGGAGMSLLGNNDFANELKIEQEKLREFVALKEKEALTLEQDIAHGPLVVATSSSGSSSSKSGASKPESTSYQRRMQIVALQGKLAEISEAKKMLTEHITNHGVLEKPLPQDINPGRRTYRKRLREAIIRRVNRRRERRAQRKQRASSPVSPKKLNMDEGANEVFKTQSNAKEKKYWRRSRRSSRASKSKKQSRSSKPTTSHSSSSNTTGDGSNSGHNPYLPFYQQYLHKIELSPSSSAFSEKLKLLDRYDSSLFSKLPQDSVWGIVHSFRAAHSPYSTMFPLESSSTCLSSRNGGLESCSAAVPSHWSDLEEASNMSSYHSKSFLVSSLKIVAMITMFIFICAVAGAYHFQLGFDV